ncbi:MAG: transcriptional regulator PpsR [Luminiphilus sp.]|nr:transcriptional regulator PpsR [Luminiphilus sp.]
MLKELDTAAIVSVLEAVADVQLQLDPEGFCIDVAVTNAELTDLVRIPWRGRRWHELCVDEHKERASEALARSASEPNTPRRVDLNIRATESSDELPMSFRLIQPASGGVIAVGRDLRVVSDLRQQVLNAQHAMEQDYWALRQMENRYRRLLELTSDGILVVDEATGRVLEANSQASAMLGTENQSIIGRPLPLNSIEMQTLLESARETGATNLRRMVLPNMPHGTDVLVSFQRQGAESRYLIRLSNTGADSNAGDMHLADAFELAPDGIVQVDSDGRIEYVNATFLEFANVAAADQVVGRTLDNWIGRSTVDMSVMLSNLRQARPIKLYASVLRNNLGTTSDIEISAATVQRGDSPKIVFFIRDISRRLTAEHPLTERLPRSIEQITERVGRNPLKDLVRESTDVIEALCIEAALKLTRDNRASAAEILGLSRQSLYTKLRRYGIGEATSDS